MEPGGDLGFGGGYRRFLIGPDDRSLEYSPFRRYRTRDGLTSLPYTGQKRLHAILGLVFGLFTCTWAFSGMMSMDPVSWLCGVRRRLRKRFSEALRGRQIQISAFADRPPREALSLAAELKVKELEFTSFAGEPSYLVTEAPGRSLIVPNSRSPLAMLDQERLVAVLAQASRPHELREVRQVTAYENYYVDRHNRLPLAGVVRRLDDAERSMYYVDPRTARIVASYRSMSRWNRWIYHGLHSIDLPWLYRHRPAWIW